MQVASGSWYIGVDGNSHGPFPFTTLSQAAADGRLTRETLVWSPGMPDWARAGDIHGLFVPPPAPQVQSVAPAVRMADGVAPHGAERDAGSESVLQQAVGGQSAGAWRRLFARWIDVWLSVPTTAFIVAVGLALVSSEWGMWLQDPTNSTFIVFFLIPLAFLLDALIVSIFGNSIGKTILGVNVRRTTGEALAFWPYAKRNFNVWAYGLGLCIPILSIFTMISQARWLKNNGATGYDVGRYRVDADKLTTLRSISAALVILSLFGAMIYFTVQEQIERRAFETGQRWTNQSRLLRCRCLPDGYRPRKRTTKGKRSTCSRIRARTSRLYSERRTCPSGCRGAPMRKPSPMR
jgi:GYF domain 2/RDD family